MARTFDSVRAMLFLGARSARAVLAALSIALAAPPALAASPEPATGRRGMVVTPHAAATQAGIDVLERGGNAVDAAITAALAVAVAQPQSTGIGGGAFILVRRADGRAFAIDARETAPTAATPDLYTRPGAPADAPRFGGLAVGTPGLVAGFALALEQHGTLSWKRALAPAIALAEDGVALGPHSRRMIEFMRATRLPARFPETARIQLPPAPVAKLRQPELAATLRLLARKGPRAFYEGPLAAKIAAAAGASGGILSEDDLAAYRPLEREPLRGEYRGVELIAFPLPSSGGVTLLEILNIVEGFDLRASGAGASLTIHRIAEAMKLGYADRARHLGDPAFVDAPVKQLLDDAYAARLRARIRDDRATPVDGSALAVDDGGTAHLSVVDAAGNAVAITQTINGPYGSWVTVPGTGILLNNEMDDFVTQPGQANQWGLPGLESAANRVEPGKRPLSSMAPLIAVQDGRVRFVAGSNGGPRIISSVLLAFLGAIEFGMDAQEAVSAPRFHHQWRPDVLELEAETPADVVDALRARGHEVKITDEITSGVEAIAVDPASGLMSGGADPRRDSAAAGID
jgi:gamma-glutamyltranspeptidase/glutathione hydrolase